MKVKSVVLIMWAVWLVATLPAGAATYSVTNNADNGAVNTLRWVVQQANATPAGDTIIINVSAPIQLSSTGRIDIQYPVAIEGRGATIIGYNLSNDIFNLVAGSDGSTLTGLALVSSQAAVSLYSSRNRISACVIGTDWIGSGSLGNNYGIYIRSSSGGNLIGGDHNAGEGNVFAGYDNRGVVISGTGNTVCGNMFGLKPDGSGLVDFMDRAIRVDGQSNYIGLPQTGKSNVICGAFVGFNGNTCRDNRMQNNQVGFLDRERVFPAAILVESGAHHNLIGGDAQSNPLVRNYVVGSASGSDIIISSGSSNTAYGNYLGLDPAGTSVIANTVSGVSISDSWGNQIGGPFPGLRNIINGCQIGIIFEGSKCQNNQIIGNWVGLLADGRQAEYKVTTGFYIGEGKYNLMGYLGEGERNLIAGTTQGIALYSGAAGNALFGNLIYSFANTATGQAIILNGSNNNKSAPSVYIYENQELRGFADPGDWIDVFRSDRGAGYHGGSAAYLGRTQASPTGYWTWSIPSTLVGEVYICLLATDSNNNTSEFSQNILVIGATQTPTPTPNYATPTPTPTATVPNPADGFDLTGRLVLAFPNPARDQVRFLLAPDRPVRVKIILFNLAGERVGTVEEALPAGRGTVAWDCRSVTAGVYVARVMLDGKEMAKLKVAVAK